MVSKEIVIGSAPAGILKTHYLAMTAANMILRWRRLPTHPGDLTPLPPHVAASPDRLLQKFHFVSDAQQTAQNCKVLMADMLGKRGLFAGVTP